MTFTDLVPRSPARRLVLALAAVWLSAAQAETGPYYIGAHGTVVHDSNVDRTPTAISDTIFQYGIFGGLDQTISRQRLRVDLVGDWNKYNHESRLDHNSGSGKVRLDWETIANLSGDLQLSHSQSLFRDFLTAEQATQKTLVKTTDAVFNARLGVVTAWTLEAGVYGNRTRYDTVQLQTNDIDYEGYRGGVRYSESSIFAIGLGGRHARGNYPNGTVGTDFVRDDVDLVVNWHPTGSSSFDGWISRSRLDYEGIDERNNTLTTGGLAYRLRPGGRLSLDVSYKRDSNAGEYNFQGIAVGVPGVSNNQSLETRIANMAAVSVGYEVTALIKLALDLRHTERQLDSALTTAPSQGPSNSDVIRETDRTNAIGLNATYDILRTVQLACGYSRIERSTTGTRLTYPYAVNLASCSAQFAIQP